MSNLEMPRFDFSGASIKSEEDLAAAEAATNKGDKYFKPGKYDVVINRVEFRGAAKSDPNWGNLEVEYRGTGEKLIRDYILVPFKDVTYGEKKSLFPFQKVKQFCAALGHTVRVETLGDTLKSVFGNTTKLTGKSVSIEVGYRKGHIKWVGKTAEGNTILHIIDRDGNAVRDADLNALEFADREAAEQFANDNKIAIDKYVNVLSYTQSATAQAPAKAANW